LIPTSNTKILNLCLLGLLIITILIRGYFALHNPHRSALKQDVGSMVTYQGTIISEPLTKDFLKTFTFETKEGFAIKVNTDRYDEYEFGDEVNVTGKLSQPMNFSGNGGRIFNYIEYLGKDGIFYEFKKAKVEVIQTADEKSPRVLLFGLKRNFIENLQRVLGEPHAALASGLVVGEKAALGKDLLDDFRRSGLVHIIVLSGYNITIIATSIRKILSFLPRTWSIILGGCGIILFGILVGGGATVVRSCIMALIALFAELARRDYNVVRALFIAGLLMLVENPLILFYDPSFQLSFLATLGLVLLSAPLEAKVGWIPETAGFRGLVATTVATQIFVSPLIFYMMGELSLIGIVVNLLVLPLIPLTMLLVFLAGFFGFFAPLVSQIPGWGSHILLSYELFMVNLFAKLPFATIEVPAFSGWIVAACYVFYLAAFLKLPSMISQFIFAKKSST
jgi:competence protein ComEC